MRLVHDHLMRCVHAKHDIAGAIQTNPARSVYFQRDGVRVGSRREVEVEFEAPVVAVKDRVDAGIDAAVLNRGVIGHVGVPLIRIVADKVVGFARQFAGSGNGGSLIAAEELDAHGADGSLRLRHFWMAKGSVGARGSGRATAQEAREPLPDW